MNLNIIEKLKQKNLKDRIKDHDQSAFEELYDQNIDNIYRFIYFKIGKKEDASDLSSAVFLKTWEYLQKNKINQKETLRALVYKITRNMIIDYYRSNKGKNISLDDDNNKIDVIDESYNIEVDISNKGDFNDLLSKIMELKNEYREILIMRFVNDLSLDEIAEITGKKKMNIRVISHRAIKALREIIDKDN